MEIPWSTSICEHNLTIIPPKRLLFVRKFYSWAHTPLTPLSLSLPHAIVMESSGLELTSNTGNLLRNLPACRFQLANFSPRHKSIGRRRRSLMYEYESHVHAIACENTLACMLYDTSLCYSAIRDGCTYLSQYIGIFGLDICRFLWVLIRVTRWYNLISQFYEWTFVVVTSNFLTWLCCK